MSFQQQATGIFFCAMVLQRKFAENTLYKVRLHGL